MKGPAAITIAVFAAAVVAGCSGRSGPRPPASSSPLAPVQAAMVEASYAFTVSATTVIAAKPTILSGQGRITGTRLEGSFATAGGQLQALVAGGHRYVRYAGHPWQVDPALTLHAPDWKALLARVQENGAGVLTGRLDRSGLSAAGFGGGPWQAGSVSMTVNAAHHVTSLVVKASSSTKADSLEEKFSFSGYGRTSPVPDTPPPS